MHVDFSTLPAPLLARAAQVELMIFDVDGVLTDGGLYYGELGEQVKRFNVHDGLAIKHLPEFGIRTAIISARLSPLTAKRAHDLGISHVYQGAQQKQIAFADLLAELNLSPQVCGYLGDDVIDLPLLRRVGFAASVANGRIEAQQMAHYVSQAGGGAGAAREVCELLLFARGRSLAELFNA
ncbi:HAD hydrolase family protein [Massilia sp. W12]|uniref:KdsC family phosphatase n=1 Tax=Massilia sp. W12 TaxID=3126507 RepID=UPI0030CDE97E